MPVLASENGQEVDLLIIYIHWLMIALFVGWLAYFLYCIWRFRASRNPKADHVGRTQPCFDLDRTRRRRCGSGVARRVRHPDVGAGGGRHEDSEKDKAEATNVQIMAQQFNWNVRYAGKDGKFGKQSMNW
jgi:cytochrome c oxidase subunit 2